VAHTLVVDTPAVDIQAGRIRVGDTPVVVGNRAAGRWAVADTRAEYPVG
jgi:hypothetical protein